MKYTSQAYLILGTVAGVLELGPMIFLIKQGAVLPAILFAGACYQLGNFFAGFSGRFKNVSVYLSGFIFFLTAAYVISQNSVVFYLLIMILSTLLQSVRRILETFPDFKSSTLVKRAFRVVGFFLAAFWNIAFLIGICVIVIFSSIIFARRVFERTSHQHFSVFSSIALIMVIHQMHYFSYAYWIVITYVESFSIPIKFVGIMFVIGWISYLFSKKLFHSFVDHKVFIIGHLSIAISLIFMAISSEQGNWILFSMFWFLSGLGGGTVYVLKKMNLISKKQVKLELWEDIGHVLGVFLLFLYVSFGYDEYFSPFYVSAIIATTVVVLLYLTSKRLFSGGHL